MDVLQLLFSLLFSLLQIDPAAWRPMHPAADRALQDLTRFVPTPRAQPASVPPASRPQPTGTDRPRCPPRC